jgi:Fe-S cluster biogenesis protein NfuA
MLEMPEVIAEALAEPVFETADEAKERKIREAIAELRPTLQRDGGDCQLVSVEGNVVKVKMTGACVGCIMASVTVHGIQAKLSAKLGAPLRVIPIPVAGGL